MQEMVPVMLGRLKGKEECVPCFVWSTQECVPVGMGDGTTIEGGSHWRAYTGGGLAGMSLTR
jgi:hypothetical protein